MWGIAFTPTIYREKTIGSISKGDQEIYKKAKQGVGEGFGSLGLLWRPRDWQKGKAFLLVKTKNKKQRQSARKSYNINI